MGARTVTVKMKLGENERAMGRFEEAADCYESALAIYRTYGDRVGECTSLAGLGHLYLGRDSPERALDCFSQALGIAVGIGSKHLEGKRRNNLGNCYRIQGRYDDAIDEYMQAIAIAREIGGSARRRPS